MALNREKKTAYSLAMELEFKAYCQKLAKEESRSLNSFITNAIKEYIKNNYEEKE